MQRIRLTLQTNYQLSVFCSIEATLTLKEALSVFLKTILQVIRQNKSLAEAFSNPTALRINTVTKNHCFMPLDEVLRNILVDGDIITLQLVLKAEPRHQTNELSSISAVLQKIKNLQSVDSPKYQPVGSRPAEGIAEKVKEQRIADAVKSIKSKLIKKPKQVKKIDKEKKSIFVVAEESESEQ